MKEPRPLAITMGDPAGIGPEIVVKLFVEGFAQVKRPRFVVGDMPRLEPVIRRLGAPSLVKDGRFLFSKGYGVADIETKRPVDPRRTLVRAYSVSKSFTATAAMQLVEAGKLTGCPS
jgi:CubicO group peptidase (beta-lactamase class C family)